MSLCGSTGSKAANECWAVMPLCSGVQPSPESTPVAERTLLAATGSPDGSHMPCAPLVCMNRAMDALRENVRARHVGLC
eukprot:6563142-Prymnesium_polylepis.2